MITSKQIRNVAKLRKEDRLIASLYLGIRTDQRIHQTKVKELIRSRREELGKLPKETRQSVEQDFEKLQDFVESFREGGYKGLAAFSCAAEKVWEMFLLPQPVEDLLVLDFSARIGPLVRSLGEYPRVCTQLINKTRARTFEIFMGEIEESSEILSDVPSKVREAGWFGLNEKRIERHTEDHLHTHLKKAADQAFNHFQTKGFDWLLLGGHAEVLPDMESLLHSYVRPRLKKTFRMDLDSHPKQILERSLELVREIKREEEKALVSRLMNSLKGTGGLGVSGIQETLSSLHEGSVQTLLVEDGFSQAGAVCFKCGFMDIKAGACPICKKNMTPVPDVVDQAVASAIDQNAEVFHVASGNGLAGLGHIGALLRHKGAAKAEGKKL